MPVHLRSAILVVRVSLSLGQGLVGQAAAEKRTLTVIAGDEVQITAGMATVMPTELLFLPVINQDFVNAVIELAPVSPTNRTSAGSP